MVKAGGAASDAALSFVAADLTSDAGWAEAVAGCTYVLHIASPFVLREPANADELIIPARDGTLRVLRAARDAGVKRVVLTSSFVAIGYGHPPTDLPFTEESWTNLDSDLNTYTRSKTIAERAAWDFIAREGRNLELTVINPVGIFGPVLGPNLSESIVLVQSLLERAMPAVPRIAITTVDVRDLADLHLRAMINPAAKGERFLATSDTVLSFEEIAIILKRHLGKAAACVPTRVMPDGVLRLVALVIPMVRPLLSELGHVRKVSNAKARRVLGWIPRSNEETIVATAESLLRLGLVGNPHRLA
jgi:dihydroflavonol-4-reductase